jgi:hypothetical protein
MICLLSLGLLAYAHGLLVILKLDLAGLVSPIALASSKGRACKGWGRIVLAPLLKFLGLLKYVFD